MSNQLPTYKQLEKNLSRKIKVLYSEQIDYPPKKVTCKLFSRYLAIVADDPLTPIEKNLWEFGEKSLSAEIRCEINSIIKPKLVELIESIISVKIEEILSNVTFKTNKSGILVILSEPPQVSNLELLPKTTSK